MKGDDGDNAGLVRITEQPLLLSKKKGTMRDYQLEGLNWMVNLYIKGINGVLADEMGLGKTLQTISLLTFLREAYGIRGKHLVIVPKSTLGNWLREFNVWSPVFKTMKFHGTKPVRKQLCKELLAGDNFDVCVTTFEMCSTEQTTLQRVKCVFVCLPLAFVLFCFLVDFRTSFVIVMILGSRVLYRVVPGGWWVMQVELHCH